MAILARHAGLYTDHYELAMAQGYLLTGMQSTTAAFDYFFRKNPYQGGYVIFAGLQDLLDVLTELRFAADDCAYLASIGFQQEFVDYLADFRFGGEIHAMNEGEVVFPGEPVMRVEGNLIETQLLETLLLNLLNFESLIATKASRLRLAAGARVVIDFGLRRAPGLGGIQASKAAVLGGANSTSNVYSAFQFGLISTGTQAHSWIQAHDDELAAFRAFADIYPQHCVLLVDTYDTLKSGIPNAIRVALEMEARGQRLFAIRLDSGDLAYLSKAARRMLDEAHLDYVKIVASNQLDEYLIKSLLEQGAPVDAFGVGTKLVTGQPDAALDGVYKLCLCDGQPRLKLSENPEKIILPGRKQVLRFLDYQDRFRADGIVLADEGQVERLYHPGWADLHCELAGLRAEPLLQPVMRQGRVLGKPRSSVDIAEYAQARLAQLPAEHKRFDNPHVYKVGISEALMTLRTRCIGEIRQRYAGG